MHIRGQDAFMQTTSRPARSRMFYVSIKFPETYRFSFFFITIQNVFVNVVDGVFSDFSDLQLKNCKANYLQKTSFTLGLYSKIAVK